MKTALINASPKRTGSASGMLLDALYPRLEGCSCTEFRLGIEKPDPQILETFADFDALVFAFPLYVDGLPAHLLRHLQALEPLLLQRPCPDRRVYTLVNCGFYEGRQTACALEMMEHWRLRAGLDRGMGLGVGAGPMMLELASVPPGHGPKEALGEGLDVLAACIKNGAPGEDRFLSVNFPRFAYRLAAQAHWRRLARANNLSARDLFRRIESE